MARAKEKTISLLGSVTVDLTGSADTETGIYTVPTGKKAIPVMVIARDFDEAVDEAVVTLGLTGGTCDEFLGDQTLTNVDTDYADQALIMQPIPNATPVAALVMDAGEQFGVEITTAETTGSAACVMDLFGYEYDA